MENSEIFSTSLKSSILQDPTITNVQKYYFIKKFLLVLEMAVLEHFGKNIVKKLLKLNNLIKFISEKVFLIHYFFQDFQLVSGMRSLFRIF